jgi:hypothetical protein
MLSPTCSGEGTLSATSKKSSESLKTDNSNQETFMIDVDDVAVEKIVASLV